MNIYKITMGIQCYTYDSPSMDLSTDNIIVAFIKDSLKFADNYMMSYYDVEVSLSRVQLVSF